MKCIRCHTFPPTQENFVGQINGSICWMEKEKHIVILNDFREMKKLIIATLLLLGSLPAFCTHILIPMDLEQSNHLKAYGIAYYAVAHQIDMSWLLNYRGGSFMCVYNDAVERECGIRGVSYQVIADVQAQQILSEIAATENNMNEIRLTKEPKIAVYSPKNKLPWDDAVTLVLTYAEIPYTVLYDEEVIKEIYPNMTGYTCTTRISRANMGNSGAATATPSGIRMM